MLIVSGFGIVFSSFLHFFLGRGRFCPPSQDTCDEKCQLMSMGGQAEGLACADPGVRTPIGMSGNYIGYSLFQLGSNLISNDFCQYFTQTISEYDSEYLNFVNNLLICNWERLFSWIANILPQCLACLVKLFQAKCMCGPGGNCSD